MSYKTFLRGIIILGLLLTACGGAKNDTKAEEGQNNSTITPTIAQDNTPAQEVAAVSADPQAIAAAMDESDRVLVWTAPAPAPGQHRADQTGDLAYLTNAGQMSTVVKVPDQASQIMPCGQYALSPNGAHFAMFMGLDTNLGGGLYLVSNGGEPRLVEDGMQYLGCWGGNGRLQYSPDSSRVAFIAYEPDARSSEFGDGAPRVLNTNDYQTLFSADSVVSYDISGDGIVFVSFFTNDRNEADEAAIAWWDGNIDTEITALRANEDCRYTSAYTSIAPDGQIWLVLGERCGNSGTEWQLHRVDREGRSTVLGLTQQPRGSMTSFSQVNNLYFTTGGGTIYYTLPDGVTANSAGLYAVNVDDLAAPRTIVERDVIVPTYSGSAHAGPVISPNGEWLAYVTATPDGMGSVYVINLNDPTATPIMLIEGGRADGVPYLQFSQDSQRLVFVAGGEENSLFSYRPGESSATRVRRGTFSGWGALSPSGNEIALMEWQYQEEGVRGDDFLNLMLINLDSTEPTTLQVGGEVVDNQVQNTVFARPLLWVR